MRKILTEQTMVPFVIALSFFMEGLDSTIINTAIPSISRSLLVDPVDLKIALISYLLSLAIFIPISGWLADKYGVKRIFISALFIFTLSSLWCAVAHNLMELVVARFTQGFGGALGLPVGRLIIVRTFTRDNIIPAMTRVVTMGALGPMLGPFVGGFVTNHFSWHWIFLVNIPVGMLAIGLSCYWLKEMKAHNIYSLDKIGFLLFGVSLAGISFGLSALSESSVSHRLAMSIIAVSILLLMGYFFHSRRLEHPIVKMDLFRFRTFRVAMTASLISRLGFGGVPFLVPLLLQISLGFSAQLSGLLLAPIAIGVLFGKPLFLPMVRKTGYRRFLIRNTLFAAVSIWCFSCIGMGTSVYVIAMLTFVYGFILTLQYSSMNLLGYADLSHDQLSSATSIVSTIQQLAQSFGVATAALCVRLFSAVFSDNVVLKPIVFHYAFLVIGFFTLLSTLIFLQLKPEDGQQLLVKS